jgi:D-glycero-D-manno-heptose 1,7-bisphosphate phosphatase
MVKLKRYATKSRPTVFLDRDGTINVEKNYLYKWGDWEWIPGAKEAIKSLNDAGYLVIVISNQAGIARNFYTSEDVDTLHTFVDNNLAMIDARIDAYYYCPHHPEYGENRTCLCRKPLPGMIFRACEEFSIDLSLSYLVGDKISDVVAAQSAGVTPILVKTGYGVIEATQVTKGVRVVQDFWFASQEIIRGSML